MKDRLTTENYNKQLPFLVQIPPIFSPHQATILAENLYGTIIYLIHRAFLVIIYYLYAYISQ